MRLRKVINHKPRRQAAARGLAGVLMLAALAAEAADIEYLYINAGEGSASGGHAALKLNDEVFHFQHVAPGWLRAQRDDFAQFRRQYGDRENRTIFRHRVEVSEATQALLRERFNRVLLIEAEQFDQRAGLAKDRRLLEIFLHRPGAPGTLALKGAGLFLADGWNYAEAPAGRARPAALARRVEAAFGPGFLAARQQALRRSLASLRPEIGDPSALALSADAFQPAASAFAERYADHLSALAALQVLTWGRAPRPGVLARPSAPEFRLDEAERQALVAYRATLEGYLLGLFRSGRADWGGALLLGMARLAALDESIASARLVFLHQAASAAPPSHTAYAWSRAEFMRAKSGLVGGGALDEWAYVGLEQAANLFLAAGEAGSGVAPAATPAWPAEVVAVPPALTVAEWQEALARLEAYQQAYEDALARLYAYNLLGRNCASEIFRVLGQALGESEASIRAESLRRLGGEVSGRFPEFIPFVSFQAVGAHWRVVATDTLPSYRLRRLAQARRAENPLLVDLRESNVLTASLYRWHGGDAAFVFFTDATVWARPLAGGVNLAAGLAQGLAGLFTWPWDGGGNLWQGAKGALISLPELFFFNIRKGSFPDLPGAGE